MTMTNDQKHLDDLKCIRSISEGNEEAYETLFLRYYLQLVRFAWRYTDSKAIAEELVQDLFLEIWEQRTTWFRGGEVRPFLYRVIKEKSLNYLKHCKIEDKYNRGWMEKWAPIAYKPEEDEDNEQIKIFQNDLGQAIEMLPARCKMIYKLHRYDGLTYKEIAQVMDISHKTVESQMTRALKFLREKLEKKFK